MTGSNFADLAIHAAWLLCVGIACYLYGLTPESHRPFVDGRGRQLLALKALETFDNALTLATPTAVPQGGPHASRRYF